MRPVTRPLRIHWAGRLPVTRCCRRMPVPWAGCKMKPWDQPVREYNYSAARLQGICNNIHTEFKLEQGYTSDEIVNKARGPKGVLEPFSTQENLDLLARAGFVDIMTVMKYVPFEGFPAIK